MTNVNVLYDGRYGDVDIISVPNSIVGCIGNLAQEYLDWIPPDDDADSWIIINSRKCISKGAVGFVRWLNSTYCLDNKAYIVSQNVPFCSKYLTVEF